MHEFNYLSSFQKNKDQDKDSGELLFSFKEYIIKKLIYIYNVGYFGNYGPTY